MKKTNEKLENTKENKNTNILWNKIKDGIIDYICGKQEQKTAMDRNTKKMEERRIPKYSN